MVVKTLINLNAENFKLSLFSFVVNGTKRFETCLCPDILQQLLIVTMFHYPDQYSDTYDCVKSTPTLK